MSKSCNLLLSLLLLLFASCAGIQEPEFRTVKDLRITSIQKGLIKLNGTAIFYNPNTVDLTLSRTDIDVMINGKKIGNINQSVTTEIQGKEEFEMPLDITIDPKELGDGDILSTALSLLNKKKLDVHYKGNIYFYAFKNDIAVPIEYKEEIPFKK